MQNTITLNVSGKAITLSTHEVEGKLLYKAQDLLKGYGLDGRKVGDTVRHWVDSMKNKLRDFRVVSIQGKNGGTYLTKRQIFKLAGYVSYEFEDAVYEAFEALSEGRTQDAIAIVNSTVIHDVMISSKSKLPQIKKLFADAELELDVFVRTVLDCSNYNTKADLQDRIKFSTALKNFVENHFNSLKGKDACDAQVAYKDALLAITEYQKRRLTQVKTRSVNRANNKVEHTRDIAKKMYFIGKSLSNDVKLLQFKVGMLASAMRNPF